LTWLAQSLHASTATSALGKGQRYSRTSEDYAELKPKSIIPAVVLAPSQKERDKMGSYSLGGRGQGAAWECQEGETSLRARALLLEDDPDGALVQGVLEAEGYICDIVRARTRVEFLEALRGAEIDVILADYKLPSFDGFTALELSLAERPDLPFIFVSSTLGEEVAIEALKMGATDYVLKTRLSRLVPAVDRALREARERGEREKAEQALRRSEMYLAEAERLSRTGSFGWDVSSGKLYWSEETYRIFGLDLQAKPTLAFLIDRTHPDDRAYIRRVINGASTRQIEFAMEHRLLMPDGLVKYVGAVSRPLICEKPERSMFVGAVVDITDLRHAEEERERLRQLEGGLLHINRVRMTGELAASLAHEIKQPMAAAVTNAAACEQWLLQEVPNVAKARKSASAMVDAAMRASDIIDRVRSLYQRGTSVREVIDLNDIMQEMTVLLADTAHRNAVSIRRELDRNLPLVTGDRVQLQQVLINLMLNGIESMKDQKGELHLFSNTTEDGRLLVSISDTGAGIREGDSERIFEAFFTTKPEGTGMGLSISRRIIEAHGGRLWVTSNATTGATFQFTLPCNNVPSKRLGRQKCPVLPDRNNCPPLESLTTSN
jgi:PAS domain S-box-containing protein